MADTKCSEDEPSKPHPSETKLKPSDEWISFIKGIRSSIIEAFWSGVQIKQTGDCNTDYGEHFSTLNFPAGAARKKRRSEVPKNTTNKDRMKAWHSSSEIIPENGQPTVHDGSRTFGLVLDKENNPKKALDTPKDLTDQQESILLKLSSALIAAMDECHPSNTRFLRINLVKGAQTIGHTDNFKNSLIPNYLTILPPNKDTEGWVPHELNFSLVVKLCPNFKTSLVIFRNEICIPFSFCDCPLGEVFCHDKEVQSGGYLQMIKLCKETDKAKWMIVNPKLISELKPYKKIKCCSRDQRQKLSGMQESLCFSCCDFMV